MSMKAHADNGSHRFTTKARNCSRNAKTSFPHYLQQIITVLQASPLYFATSTAPPLHLDPLHRILHHQLPIKPMQPLNPLRHRLSRRHPLPLEKHTRQAQLNLPLLLLNTHPRLEQPITAPYALLPWRPAAAQRHFRRRAVHDLEVVSYDGSFWEIRRVDGGARPEVRLGGGIAVFAREVAALEFEYWMELVISIHPSILIDLSASSSGHGVGREDWIGRLPRPPNTPAVAASTSAPSFSRSSGRTLDSGIRRITISCVTGLLFGFWAR